MARKVFEMDSKTLLKLVGKYYAEELDKLPGDSFVSHFEVTREGWFGHVTGVRFTYESKEND